MKILIHASNFTPDPIGAGKFTGEMAAWLAAQGHQVRAVVSAPFYPFWKIAPGYSGMQYRQETVDGVLVMRCPIFVPSRRSGLARLLQQCVGAMASLPPLLFWALSWKPDIVWTVAPTLATVPGALAAARLAHAPAWLHIQDFEVDAAFGLGLLKTRGLKTLLLALEQNLLAAFHTISSITPRMLARVGDKRVAARLVLFPNWVDLTAVYPLTGPSPLRTTFAIAPQAFVALYSGNLGEKQGVDDLIAVARLLAAERDFLLVIGGDGAGRERLAALAQDLQNVRFLPLQPAEQFNQFLNMADVHLLPQKAQVADFVMPSKLPGMLASGRPVIAGAPPGTQLAQEVEGAGLVVAPGDPPAMADAIRVLKTNPARCLALGVAAAQRARTRWNKEEILSRFAGDLSLAARRGR